MSQGREQLTAVHILPSISRNKDNQAMTTLFKNCTENVAGRLFPDLFLFFKNDL